MSISTCIVVTEHLDIHAHLALEEVILDGLAPGAVVLLLWRAGPAVVLGKNQNPWLETCPARLAADAVPLARRISGGGTVWHDPGNLNVSVFIDRATYDVDRVGAFMLDAVRTAGVLSATLGPRHVLMVGERKFSGNAFCYRRNRVLHHGTMLAHADLDRLEAAIRPAFDRDTVVAKAIASVRSRVLNLCEIAPTLTIDRLRAALIDAFRHHVATGELTAGTSSPAVACPVLGDGELLAHHPGLAAQVPELLARHRGWDWQIGYTPAFTARLPLEPPTDGSSARVALGLRIEHGRVAAVALDPSPDTSDAAPASPFGTMATMLESTWRGCRFEASALRAALTAGLGSPNASPSLPPPLQRWLQSADF